MAQAQEGVQGIASPQWFETTLHHISLLAEMAGVGVIIIGAVAAMVFFVAGLSRGENRKVDCVLKS